MLILVSHMPDNCIRANNVIMNAMADIESAFYDIESIKNDIRNIQFDLTELDKKLHEVTERMREIQGALGNICQVSPGSHDDDPHKSVRI